MNTTRLDHVGILVNSAVESARLFSARGIDAGAPDDFPSEGTREVYVGPDSNDGRVLLIEAIGPGPYRSAMERRGPGLHHVALGVLDVESFVEGLCGSGWYLHPASLNAFLDTKSVWLTRPGVPVLFEVLRAMDAPASGSVVTRCALPIPQHLVNALACPALVSAEDAVLEIGTWTLSPKAICLDSGATET